LPGERGFDAGMGVGGACIADQYLHHRDVMQWYILYGFLSIPG